MKSSAKIFQKLLEDPDSKVSLTELLDDMIDSKLENQDEYEPVLKAQINYVGIEVECFSELKNREVMTLILEHDLEKYINIADDGSIEVDGTENTYEFRILSTEKELSVVFKKLAKFFKEGKFDTNNSCGLHVHLDMRNRDVEKCYQKLLKFQHLMFPLVDKERWTNEYCPWSVESRKYDRDAVNHSAYEKHETIEIRLHHGTTDVKQIQNWVNLLLRAIKSAPIKEIKSKAQAVKWAGKDKKLKSYIKKEFNTSWFKDKDKVMEGYNDDYDGGDEDVW